MILKLMELFSLLVLFIYTIYYILNIYQQEHYSSKKLMKFLPTFYFKKVYMDILYIYLILLVFNNPYHTLIMLLLTIFILLKPTKYVIRLKFTTRIIRLLTTIFILLIIPFFLLKEAHLLLFATLMFFLPFILLLANLINMPVEKLIQNRYLKQAKKKYYQNDQLIKIAITGSYGKTSTKNILNHILNKTYLTLATPKSYNTLMGLTKTINNDLKANHEVFIMEMGAFRQGEIKQMVNAFSPDISVITEVGPQHLSTFKTIEGVRDAKLEIISNQAFESSLVINTGNEYLKQAKIINILNIYQVGYDDSNEYYLEDIKTIAGKTTFTIKAKDHDIYIESPLLGKHNALNILICYGIIQALKSYNIVITDEEFRERIKTCPRVPHRLEYKQIKNYHIYDDSYNANIKGFTAAINLFEELDTKKVIITPGIVDGGDYSKEINEDIANKMLNKFDDIYLIKNEVIKYYIDIFKQNGQSYQIFTNFKDAFSAFKDKYKEEVSLLIENDLPDNFLER